MWTLNACFDFSLQGQFWKVTVFDVNFHKEGWAKRTCSPIAFDYYSMHALNCLNRSCCGKNTGYNGKNKLRQCCDIMHCYSRIQADKTGTKSYQSFIVVEKKNKKIINFTYWSLQFFFISKKNWFYLPFSYNANRFLYFTSYGNLTSTVHVYGLIMRPLKIWKAPCQ